MKLTVKNIFLLCGALFLIGCGPARPKLKTMDNVDLPRYMGTWYVIAAIPIFLEKDAYNAIEKYTLDPDGTVDTIFTFNKGSFDGPAKHYRSRGFVVDKINNSTWKIQFVWPFKAEYLITSLNDDYSQVIVSRNKRDHVWIMARTPVISEEDFKRLRDEVEKQGYDLKNLRRVPQNEHPS